MNVHPLISSSVHTFSVLVLDDDNVILQEISEALNFSGFQCVPVDNINDAINIISCDQHICVAVVDLNVCGRTGFEVISAANKMRSESNKINFIVLSGEAQKKDAIRALKEGVFDFLEKPIELNVLLQSIKKANESAKEKFVRQILSCDAKSKALVKRQSHSNSSNHLNVSYKEVLECLTVASGFKDPETGQHIRRIGAYASIIGDHLGWSTERLRTIELAAPLHDVGKIGIDDSVLLKNGPLSRAERQHMKMHTEIGFEILRVSNQPVMKMAADIALNHHERWDGSGYPNKRRKLDIPIEARITALVDVYDALRSVRPYKPAFSHTQSLSIIFNGDERTIPTHFDPELLNILKIREREFERVFNTMRDDDTVFVETCSVKYH